MNKKIIGISGSIKKISTHLSILNEIRQWLPSNIDYEIYHGLGEIPHFNPDIDNDSPLSAIKNFREKIKAADGIIICTPEYAFGVPGTLKNAIDWTVSSGEFVDKPVALITASSVGENGHAAMLKILSAVAAIINENHSILISFIRSKMNDDGTFKDKIVDEKVKLLVNNFAISL